MANRSSSKKVKGHEAQAKLQADTSTSIHISATEKCFAGKTFTTTPKLRRLTLHKQTTVRNRAYALQESFYPTTDMRYEAVKTRLATLLGICDKGSVLAYLGRPETFVPTVIEQTTHYTKTGTVVPKTIRWSRKLPALKGYIETFSLGYVYVKDGEWWIHWNHKFQPTLPELSHPEKCPRSPSKESVRESSKCSIEDFSLPIALSNGLTVSPVESVESKGNDGRLDREIVEREERVVYKRERNCESKSIHRFHGKDHEPKVKVFSESPRAKPKRRTAKEREGDGDG